VAVRGEEGRKKGGRREEEEEEEEAGMFPDGRTEGLVPLGLNCDVTCTTTK
jgi:hypothetical protein